MKHLIRALSFRRLGFPLRIRLNLPIIVFFENMVRSASYLKQKSGKLTV